MIIIVWTWDKITIRYNYIVNMKYLKQKNKSNSKGDTFTEFQPNKE